MATTSFPQRLLQIDQGRRHASFSYREPWTVPPWTLYLLAPPPGFHAEILRLDPLDGAESIRARPASDDGVLYYFALVQGNADRVAFEVEARFVYSPRDAEKTMLRAERVERNRWAGLWEAAVEPLSTAGRAVSVAAAIKTLIG